MMSERESEQSAAEQDAATPEPGSSPAAEPTRPVRGFSRAALWLASFLILILAGVALSPFWAPQIAPLLPWGDNRADYTALAARVAAVESRPGSPSSDIDAVKSAMNALARRVDQIETGIDALLAKIEKSPAAASADSDKVSSALSALARRVDHLEASTNEYRQAEAAAAATRAGVQQIEQRLATIETQSVSRMASEAGALRNTEQELSRLGKLQADIADRISALEREGQAQAGDELRTSGTLALLLGQMREGIEQERPFPAEYDAFARLARDSELAAAVQPLAEPAHNGVASRAVLVKQLAELSRQVTAESEPESESDWGAQTLARLRGLVTIRRIDAASKTGPEAAASSAQTALARGDLPGAVAALDPLTGANADAVRPWLRMARERLAAEAALDRLQEILTARLGSPPAGPVAAPPKTPVEPSEKARTRS
ncbi:MAG TPA: hypothetical protein VGF39_11070 [Stellaceae bacterium]